MDQATTVVRRRVWFPIVVGVVIGAVGVILAGGGAWLAAIGGSLYYLLAGLALIVSGHALIRGRANGAWIYFATFAATVVWALWEADGSVWALVPRLVGPSILLLLVILALPKLTDRVTPRAGWLAALGALVLIVAGGTVAASNDNSVTQNPLPGPLNLAVAGPVGPDWPAYGGTYAAQRYSPLDQINRGNVKGLERAWLYHTGDMPSEAAKDKYGAETTPLKVGDTLYLCSAKNILIALDPATGKQRWRYDPRVDDKFIPYTAACRGVAYHAIARADANAFCATRIIEGTLDGRIIAVDARTGRPCPGFGNNGQVSITEGMGEVAPGMVSITSPPTIVRGVIVTGHQVLDGQERQAPSGVIKGFDVVTGQLRWAWDMVNPQWTGSPPAGQTYAAGTPNMWTIASGDEALGLAYLPMGNSAVDYWSGSRRSQENQFSTALVAIDVATGKPRWTFQTVRKDVWDYDLGAQASLVDLPGGVPALILPSKQGDMYVLDRRTGRPLTPVEERAVPQGGVEPEQRSPTQPFSLYHTLRKADLKERDMWGMSPIDQMFCRIQYRRASYQGYFTPPTHDRPFIEYPGYNGGTDWGGIAIDPRRGLIVANYNDTPNYNRLLSRAEADELGLKPRRETGELGKSSSHSNDPQAGSPYAISVNAGWRVKLTGLLCKEPPYGGIRAISLATGKTVWDRSFGTARRNGPFGIPSMLPATIGTPNNGGAVVTAGGLVFIAAATDNLIRAIDVNTGETLWQDVLPAGGQATPMTYTAGGRQYLVIMTGGHHFMETPVGDEVIAYALPQ